MPAAGFGWRDMKKKEHRLLVLALALAAYLWSAWSWMQTSQQPQRSHFLLDSSVTALRAEEIWQSEQEQPEPLAFCFWEQMPQQQVLCSLTGRSASVTLVCLRGNPELLDVGALAWQEGCFVDDQTAQTLFGTDRGSGQILTQNGQDYPVLGVIPALGPTLVRLAQPEESFSRCVLPKGAGADALMRWGLSGKVLDWQVLTALTADLLLVTPALLLVWLCRMLGRGWRELRLSQLTQQKVLAGKAALSLLLAAAGLWLLVRLIQVPEGMIPSKWSDFSFWGRWWQQQEQNFLLLLSTPLGNRQLQMAMNMVKSMVLSITSGALALAGLPRVKKEKEEVPCEYC